MTDCICPPTVGNSHLGTVEYVPECPVHGKVAPKLKDLYFPEGICPVCKRLHRQGEVKGCCGKG